MIVSGLVMLVFVPLHLVTFKYGPHYAAAEAGVRDLYRLADRGLPVAGLRRLLRRRHGRRGPAPAPWRVEQPAVARPDSGSLDASCFWRPGWLLALAVGAGFVLIPIYIYLFVHPGSLVQP